MVKAKGIILEDLPPEAGKESSFFWDGAEFREMVDHPGYYISDDGRIISTVKRQPRILATWPNKAGHEYFSPAADNGRPRERLLVHREVAKAFIPNDTDGNIVRHLNDIPNDNRVCNLAWGTQKDNVEDCRNNGRMLMKKIYCYELDKTFESATEAAKELGVTKAAISCACNGKTYSASGVHVCFEEEKEEKLKDPEWLGRLRNNKTVRAINEKTGVVLTFPSRKDAQKALGVHSTSITNVIAGRLKHAGGWIFEEGE